MTFSWCRPREELRCRPACPLLAVRDLRRGSGRHVASAVAAGPVVLQPLHEQLRRPNGQLKQGVCQ